MDAAQLTQLFSQVQFYQMTVNESAIARAWLIRHQGEFDEIEFNPQMGTPPDLGPGFDAVTQQQAARLMAKRSDIIASRGDEATIVEVKPRLSFSALGQLLGYRLLYHLAHPEFRKIHLVAIGHGASIDTLEVLMAYGVNVELFPDVTLVGVRFGGQAAG